MFLDAKAGLDITEKLTETPKVTIKQSNKKSKFTVMVKLKEGNDEISRASYIKVAKEKVIKIKGQTHFKKTCNFTIELGNNRHLKSI